MNITRGGLAVVVAALLVLMGPFPVRADKVQHPATGKDAHKEHDDHKNNGNHDDHGGAAAALVKDRLKALNALAGAYEAKDEAKIKSLEKKIEGIDDELKKAKPEDVAWAMQALVAEEVGRAGKKADDKAKEAGKTPPAGLAAPAWVPKKEHKHGIFDFAFEQAIWTLTVFILLLIILKKFAWTPILEGLRKREEHIRLSVEEAKLARQETEKIRLEFKADMDKAYAEIPKIMEEARRDAVALRDEMRSRAAADIQTDRDRLRREIETARDQALKELWDQTATLATLISAKAIGRSLSAEDHRRLNEEALIQVESATSQAKQEMQRFGEEWSRKGGGN